MESGLFSDPADIRALIKGIRVCQQIASAAPFRAMGAKMSPIPFYGCEHHVIDSDTYWECVLRSVGATIQHQVGTCKMGPSWDRDAVVNPDLQVVGVHNLRVVDTSIIPDIIAGHTNSVAMLIGEKAADLIKEYWGNQIPIER